ncbi:hypothetical protein [Brachybacterium sp. AOP29-B2-41]
MSASTEPTEEVLSAAATDAGVTAVTQRGAVIGLKLLIDEE